MLDQIKEQLAGLPLTDLLTIQNYVDDRVAELASDVVAGQIYDQLRFEFAKTLPAYILDTFKLWRHTKPQKQRQFSKAWSKAVRYFLKLNKAFKDTPALHAVIVEMVVTSPYFRGKVLFEDLTQTLEQIEILFDHDFPGYRSDPEALELLASKLQ